MADTIRQGVPISPCLTASSEANYPPIFTVPAPFDRTGLVVNDGVG